MKMQTLAAGDSLPNVLMIGTGEYTTGFVHGNAARSDKQIGVVGVTLFDLRRRGKVARLAMVGTNGTKFPAIRAHFDARIARRYRDMDTEFSSFPADHVPADASAYLTALDALAAGDIVTIFTPDHLHFEMAMAAVDRGLHVLIAKPIVKTLAEHRQLAARASEMKVLVAMEVHKRWDPMYRDARDRMQSLGALSFFQAYMSQPKTQLETFRHWAGSSSDISYYLNAHHVDFCQWALPGARPLSVSALASCGVARRMGIETEDTITLGTQWDVGDGHVGSGLFTSSWIAPPSDVHSQQGFFFMGHQGEIRIDQAHRGYTMATDVQGPASLNPLFMKYTPSVDGYFAGQSGYGYQSIEAFVDAVIAIRQRVAAPDDFHQQLATVQSTLRVTAILEAGRISLDNSGRTVILQYDAAGNVVGLA
jgi:D-galacturonate reductase